MNRPRIIAVIFLSFFVFDPLTSEAQRQPPTRLEQLCQITDCLPTLSTASSPLPPPQPKITMVQGTVTPGGKVLISGSGFGDIPGTLYLAGSSGWGLPRPLKVDWWHDTFVWAIIPDFTGVIDQRVAFVLITSGNLESNLWSATFTATRDVIVLKGATQVVYCHDADQRNYCVSTGGAGTGNSLEALHAGWVFGSRGTDVYLVTLKNGWVLDAMHGVRPTSFTSVAGWALSYVFGSGSASLSGFNQGANSSRLEVHWAYPAPGTGLRYSVGINVVGPKGVPYQ